MKPKDFKYPFRWEERRPLLEGRVFYVPDYYQEHHLFPFPPFEDPQLFGNTNPVHLEYCSGNGTWIVEKARSNPHLNWVAVEWDFERVRKIASKACNAKLSNLFVISGEALTFTKHYLPKGALEQVYVNFPDPWPKKRHAKHRLFRLPFILEVARALKPGGFGTFVTDDIPYSEQICEVLLESKLWNPLMPPPYYKKEAAGYGTSFFDTLFRAQGKEIRFLEWITLGV